MPNDARKIQQAFDKSVDLALDRAIKKVFPLVKEACDRWGLCFLAGNGGWTLDFMGIPGTYLFQAAPPVEGVGTLEITADPKWLFDYFEEKLVDCLEIDIGQCSLGSQLDNYAPSKKYKEVVIVGNKWYLDEPGHSIKIEPLTGDRSKLITLGPISIELAQALLTEYENDWDTGSQLLGCLPIIKVQD
jgi:hypothetical protein